MPRSLKWWQIDTGTRTSFKLLFRENIKDRITYQATYNLSDMVRNVANLKQLRDYRLSLVVRSGPQARCLPISGIVVMLPEI